MRIVQKKAAIGNINYHTHLTKGTIMTSENKGKFTDNLETYISQEIIQTTVKRLAKDISEEYYDKNPIVLSILKGSFMFTSDLVKLLDFELTLEFITLSSYGNKTESSRKVKFLGGLNSNIKDRHVLIVEDIIDTGHTLKWLEEYLNEKGAKTTKLVALASKPSRREKDVIIDFLGFEVEDKFIVGYGADFCEKYRNLPYIAILKNSCD